MFLIISGLISFIEITDRMLFRPKSIFARGVMDFEKYKSDVQILFLGQSDMQFGIDPTLFKYKSYNLASSGESFIETYYKLKYYLQDMTELKVVVLPVILPTFSSYRANEIQWEYFSYGYIGYSDFKELYSIKGPMVVREKLLSFIPVVKRMPMIYFIRNVKRLIFGEPIDRTELVKGHVREVGNNANAEVTEERLKRQLEGQNPFDDSMLLYFRKILTLCNDNNIKVFMITLPQHNYYLEQSKKYLNMEMTYRKVINNPEYSKYIYRYLDLSRIYVNNQDNFLNQDHLNAEGAEKVSELIASEWYKPMDQIIHSN